MHKNYDLYCGIFLKCIGISWEKNLTYTYVNEFKIKPLKYLSSKYQTQIGILTSSSHVNN